MVPAEDVVSPSRAQGTSKLDRRIILLLATLLLVNPFVLFLLSRSVVLSMAACIVCVGALQLSYRSRALLVVMFNSLALMSAFVHAEVLLIYGFPSHVIENLYTMENGYYFNRPTLDQRFRSNEFAVSYRTNVQGFRIGAGQEPTHDIAETDWLVLGDSFTQGAQVEFEDLYSTKLNLRFPDKVVVNAGISGMGIAHEYRYFADKGRRLTPSLVILQLGSFNDFMNVEPWPVSVTEHLLTRSALCRLPQVGVTLVRLQPTKPCIASEMER